MATTRTRKPASPSARQPAPRKRPASGGTSGRKRPGRQARKGELPGWKDLGATGKKRSARTSPKGAYLEKISNTRFMALILLVAAFFTLYVGHVHATQALRTELERAQRDNLRLHLKHNRLKGEFDQATGPAVIYREARALGLEEGITYGPAIRVAPVSETAATK